MDQLMNTSYVCLLYILNVAMLMTALTVTDIVFSALAIRFIKDIDESFSMSGW